MTTLLLMIFSGYVIGEIIYNLEQQTKRLEEKEDFK